MSVSKIRYTLFLKKIKKDVYQLTTAASEGTIVAYSIIKKNKK